MSELEELRESNADFKRRIEEHEQFVFDRGVEMGELYKQGIELKEHRRVLVMVFDLATKYCREELRKMIEIVGKDEPGFFKLLREAVSETVKDRQANE